MTIRSGKEHTTRFMRRRRVTSRQWITVFRNQGRANEFRSNSLRRALAMRAAASPTLSRTECGVWQMSAYGRKQTGCAIIRTQDGPALVSNCYFSATDEHIWVKSDSAAVCIAENPIDQCPLWVRNGHCGTSDEGPLFPRKRTLVRANATSALWQKRTFAVDGRRDSLSGMRFNPLS